MEIQNIYNRIGHITHVVIDSRKVESGCVFFALKGPNFDGNQFAAQALEKGALFVVVDDARVVQDDRYILVSDVLSCMQNLAQYKRNKNFNIVIGLTGSNGKTTTKELCRDVLKKKHKVYATLGNYNNHIGVPLTILQAPLDIDILILEMGANHQGEIDTLCQIGQPNYGIITNIGKAHLEGFGGIEGVKKGKSELYKFLAEKKEGKIFINTDDSILLNLIPKSVSQIEYSILADFKHIVSKPSLNFEYKSIHIKTQLFGDYNIHNIACAISVGRYFDIDLLQCISAIEEYIPDNNRSQKIVKNNTTYILDAYNANPSSMEVSITNFSQIEGKKAVILGDMLELGDTTDLEHITILELIKKLKIQDAFFVGPNFYKHRELFNFYFFENVENFKPSFETLDLENTTVLLKGSRGIAIERLIQ